jgi:5'-3' exonuclease
MNKKYLLLDCNYLCHRAKYTTGDLSYGGDATGVIYGFLKSLGIFQDLFRTSNFVFCFDSAKSKRKEIYPEYKANRWDKEKTEEEIEFDKSFRKQVKKLRTTYLPMIGFKNVFIQKGYESDDVIASFCGNLQDGEEAIIISSDHDLYQCIAHNVSFYNPQSRKILTLQGFKKQYGIKPTEWALVKAIAGCATDNIKGIKGIGEKTAIKYLKGDLKKGKKLLDINCSDGVRLALENHFLVCLPMKGTKKFKITQDELSKHGWRQVIELLGMKSIRDRMPFGRKRV